MAKLYNFFAIFLYIIMDFSSLLIYKKVNAVAVTEGIGQKQCGGNAERAAGEGGRGVDKRSEV